MKHLLLFFLLFFAVQQTNAQTDKHINFAHSFVQKVTVHDQKAVIKMMDKAYRTEQIAFLGGNTEQFVNELFGGIDLFTEEFVGIQFENILRIEIAEIIDLENGSFEYIFRLRDGKVDFLSSLKLVGTKKLGFVGAVG